MSATIFFLKRSVKLMMLWKTGKGRLCLCVLLGLVFLVWPIWFARFCFAYLHFVWIGTLRCLSVELMMLWKTEEGRETFQIEMKIDRRHRHRRQHLRKNVKIANMCVFMKRVGALLCSGPSNALILFSMAICGKCVVSTKNETQNPYYIYIYPCFKEY